MGSSCKLNKGDLLSRNAVLEQTLSGNRKKTLVEQMWPKLSSTKSETGRSVRQPIFYRTVTNGSSDRNREPEIAIILWMFGLIQAGP